jgi:hypothetical protein
VTTSKLSPSKGLKIMKTLNIFGISLAVLASSASKAKSAARSGGQRF